jgi:hypothetical protein
MPTYSLINNGDSGLSVRTNLNEIIGDINSGVIGATGPAGTSGTSGAAGTSGTSGVSGSSSPTQSMYAISKDLVWRSQGAFGENDGGWLTGGGIYTDYPQGTTNIEVGQMRPNTFVLRDGETISSFRWRINSVTTPGVAELSIHNLVNQTVFEANATYSACRIGTKLKDLGTMSITTGTEYQLNNINFTGSSDLTFNNVYALVLRNNNGAYTIRNAGNTLLLPDVGGGYESSFYYRGFISRMTATVSSTPADLATYSISVSTTPGWFFGYRKYR